ncbi:unnamed protein product [Symbiodinium sp. CCMP2592]|nr:unnamed protein product [Symbiodinium sp. CCMP2592]
MVSACHRLPWTGTSIVLVVCLHQVFGKSYAAAVGSDSFVDMIKNTSAHRTKLSMLSEGVLRSAQTESSEESETLMTTLAEPLVQVSASILYLLSPVPVSGLEKIATADKVVTILKGSAGGKSPLLGYVRTAFKEVPFWSQLWNESMTRGTLTLEQAPMVQALCVKLDNEEVPVSLQDLTEAAQTLSKLKDKVRTGALAALEASVLNVAKARALKIVEENAKGCSASDLDALQQTFKNTGVPNPELLSLVGKLQKIQSSQAESLATADLKRLLDLPTGPDGFNDLPPSESFSGQAILQMFRNVATDALAADPTILKGLWLAVYWLYRLAFKSLRDAWMKCRHCQRSCALDFGQAIYRPHKQNINGLRWNSWGLDESDIKVIVANAASFLSNLGHLRKLVDRLPADDTKSWFIDNVDGLKAGMGFAQARQEYASLGPDACTQLERDKNGVKLEQLLVASRQLSKILKKLESLPRNGPVNASFAELPLQDFLCDELLQQWGKDNVMLEVLKAKTDDVCSGIQKLLSELDDITHSNHKGGKWKSAVRDNMSLKETLTCANAAIMWIDVNKLEAALEEGTSWLNKVSSIFEGTSGLVKVLQVGKTEMIDIRIFLLEGTLVVLCQNDDDESKVKGFRSQLAELADGLPENKVCAQLLAEAKSVCEAADRAKAAAGQRPKLKV